MSRTSKVKQFDRPTLRLLRKNLETDLSKIGKKYGIKMDMGNFSFSSEKFTTRMTVSVATKSTAMKNEDKSIFVSTVNLYYPNINATKAFNGKFVFRGRTYTVTEVKPSRRRYPFLCKRDDGTGFKFPADVISREFPHK